MRELIKKLVRIAGYEIKPIAKSPYTQVKTILDHYGVNVIFDIGASVGWYGRTLRQYGYRGRIVSFEPLAASHKWLTEAARVDPLWEVAPRMAIGAEDGEVEMNVAANWGSSSILPMLDAHLQAEPHSGYLRTEKVTLHRLDALATDYLRSDSVAFLKADTQGYEDRVLRGAAETLKRLVGLQIEVSFHPLYGEQALFFEMVERHIPKDFQLWALWSEFTNQQTGQLLCADAIFMRR